MKKILPYLALVCSLTGCDKPAQRTVETSNYKFRVELLFEQDGMKVYRFYDGGQNRYFVDARGSTESIIRQGKAHIGESIQTIK